MPRRPGDRIRWLQADNPEDGYSATVYLIHGFPYGEVHLYRHDPPALVAVRRIDTDHLVLWMTDVDRLDHLETYLTQLIAEVSPPH